MLYTSDSLFQIALKFVIKHIDVVESFVGFPSLIAEDIFNKFAFEYTGVYDDVIHNVLKKFVEAYENLMLERLNLSGNLLLLNEYFETLITISCFISELCVCDCSLGENHELFSHISEFKRLKKLCMKDNNMNDSSIRTLTLRIRIYGIGGKEIEYLNFAGNNFTESIIPWLSAFPMLQYLNLSGSRISEEGIQNLEQRYRLRRVLEKGEHEKIESKGWAVTILEKWNQNEEDRKARRKEKKLVYKKNICDIGKPHPVSSLHSTSLIFRKAPTLTHHGKNLAPSTRKRKISPGCDQKKIEEDLFAQYR